MKKLAFCLLLALAGVRILAQDVSVSISIPAIEVNAPIVEVFISDELRSWDVSGLRGNVGHLEATGWFGQALNIVLAGHSIVNEEADVFYRLSELEIGDEIIIEAGGNRHNYTVTEIKIVGANDWSILIPSTNEILTIFTCDTSNFDLRHVVIAIPV